MDSLDLFANANREKPSSLADLSERLKRWMDAGQVQTEQVLATFDKLRRTLATVAESQELKEIGDSAIGRERLDLVHVSALLAAGQFASLKPREARFVVGNFLDREPRVIGGLLAAWPRLWKTYVRKLLTHWYSSAEDPSLWSQFADLVLHAPADLAVVGGPIPVATLVRADGADEAAQAARGLSLEACYRRLTEDWGYGRAWGLTAAAALAWVRHVAKTEKDVNSAVRFLAADETGSSLRYVLLPEIDAPKTAALVGRGGARGSDLARRHAVAEMLQQRFGEKRISEQEFLLLEPFLLRGRFGDPRLVNVSNGWRDVQQLAPAPYAAYLESLIREDLAFFFRQSMKEFDREAFWLHYVGSIRRTICVLDPLEHQRLKQSLASATPEIRAALDRALRPRTSCQDRANGFCLLFDHIAVVEFSVTGNAGFVYDRARFESELVPRIVSGKLNSVTSLKKEEASIHRLLHHRGWQTKMEAFLRSCGIRRDRH